MSSKPSEELGTRKDLGSRARAHGEGRSMRRFFPFNIILNLHPSECFLLHGWRVQGPIWRLKSDVRQPSTQYFNDGGVNIVTMPTH